jgi:hypothetical protein
MRRDLMQALKDLGPVSHLIILVQKLFPNTYFDDRNSSDFQVETTWKEIPSRAAGSGMRPLVPSRTALAVPQLGNMKRPVDLV